MHRTINGERDQEPKVTFGGATNRRIRFIHSSPNQAEVGVPADQALSPGALGKSPHSCSPSRAWLTENDDHAVLDGLDFRPGEEPSVVPGARVSICGCKEGAVKRRAVPAERTTASWSPRCPRAMTILLSHPKRTSWSFLEKRWLWAACWKLPSSQLTRRCK